MSKETRHLIGRDPGKGRVTFKSGVILTQKDRLGNRNSKAARRQLRRELGE